MAESLGDAVLTLRTDDSKLDAGIDAAKGKAESVAAKFTDVSTRVGDAGKKLSLGLTLPLAAFGVSAGKAASDAEELQSAFDTTFGELSSDMNRWAEATGDAMGRSTQELQRAGQMFGIFFNQAAPSKQAAADLSKEFSQLAQDLGSFYNVDPGEAMEKLRSGLSGEAEPLRNFGVFLTEASVAAKAMELGLASSNKELSEQDKILARAALIMEQTKNAQGDVARTSGSTANQVRASKAAYEELQVTIGTKLLPVVTPLITSVASLLNWFTQLPAPVQSGVVGLLAFSAAFGPALIGIGGLLRGVGSLVAIGSGIKSTVDTFGLLKNIIPIITSLGRALLVFALNPVFLTIAALVAGVYLAWANWDKIKPIIDAVGSAVTNWWNANIQPILTAVGNKVKELVGIFQQYFGTQIRNVVALITTLMNGDFRGAWTAMKNIVMTAIDGAWNLIKAFAPNVAKAMQAAIQNMIASGRDMILGLAAGIRASGEAVWNALKAVVLAGVNRIRDFLGIRSPSLLFSEIGGFIIDGLVKGIEGGARQVDAAMDIIAKKIEGNATKWAVDIDGGPIKLPDDGGSRGSPTDPDADVGNEWREGFRNWFKDGIRAAVDGDLGGFLKNWLSGIADGMFDRALDTLADFVTDLLGSLFSSGGSGGGDALGGIATAISSLFGGGLSTGGKIPTGKFALVGEKGPELAYAAPGGIGIRPNTALSSFRPQAASPSITMPININAPGADAAALGRVQASLDQLRADLPGTIVQTVQDAGDRRIISPGAWR